MTKVLDYKLEHCRPACPKAAKNWNALYEQIEEKIIEMDFIKILSEKFNPVLYHHVPKICLAGCPNSCSQPQIKDIGVVGYISPEVVNNKCTGCGLCKKTCLEKAITIIDKKITINYNRCVSCGECIGVCPSKAIIARETGWTIMLAGRVGRHPRFAQTIGQLKNDDEVIKIVFEILNHYIEYGEKQERLNHFIEKNINLFAKKVNDLNVHKSNCAVSLGQ